MNLRGKIFHKNNKRVYKALNIDFFNNNVDVLDRDINTTFDFKDLIFLESTGIKGEKGYIYKNDFIIAKNDKKVIRGVVKKLINGAYYLQNTKKGILIQLKDLEIDGYKFINLGNASLYFDKLKNKKK